MYRKSTCLVVVLLVAVIALQPWQFSAAQQKEPQSDRDRLDAIEKRLTEVAETLELVAEPYRNKPDPPKIGDRRRRMVDVKKWITEEYHARLSAYQTRKANYVKWLEESGFDPFATDTEGQRLAHLEEVKFQTQLELEDAIKTVELLKARSKKLDEQIKVETAFTRKRAQDKLRNDSELEEIQLLKEAYLLVQDKVREVSMSVAFGDY